MSEHLKDFTEEQLLQELGKRRKIDNVSMTSYINLMSKASLQSIKEADSWHFLRKKIRQELLDIAIKHLQLLGK